MEIQLIRNYLLLILFFFILLSCKKENVHFEKNIEKTVKPKDIYQKEDTVLKYSNQNSTNGKCILLRYKKKDIDLNKAFSISDIKGIFSDSIKINDITTEGDPPTIFVEGKNFSISFFENYVSEITFTSNLFQLLHLKIKIGDNIKSIIKQYPEMYYENNYYILRLKECECSYIFYCNGSQNIVKISIVFPS